MPTREFKAGVIKDLESIFVDGKVAIVADLNGYTDVYKRQAKSGK